MRVVLVARPKRTLGGRLLHVRLHRTAAEYLDEWAAPERAWLRKYYVPGQDEPVYDLTAAAEDVMRWVENLRGRDFVATQSRLTSIFALLKTLVQQSETDPAVRLDELPGRLRCLAAVMVSPRPSPPTPPSPG
jgi:hypothetical protein